MGANAMSSLINHERLREQRLLDNVVPQKYTVFLPWITPIPLTSRKSDVNKPSKTCSLPSLDETCKDCRHPIDIFPERIWFQIFAHLEHDPRDMLNLMEVCSLFDTWYKDDEPEYRLAELIPLVFKWLPKVDGLNCRRLSTLINKRVDHLTEAAHDISPYSYCSVFPKLTNIPSSEESKLGGLEFDRFKTPVNYQMMVSTEEEWNDFEGRMKNHHGKNPFIGEALCLRLVHVTPPQQHPFGHLYPYLPNFLCKSLEMLERYQNHLRCLSFCLGYRNEDSVKVYKVVHSFLSKLPHLTCLRGHFVEVRQGHIGPVPEDETFHINDYIKLNPLPEHSCIEHISLYEFRIPASFFREIVSNYGSQLKSLQTNEDIVWYADTNLANGESLIHKSTKFPSLVYLSLTLPARMHKMCRKIDASGVAELHLGYKDDDEANSPAHFHRLVKIFVHFPCLNLLKLDLKMGRAGVKLEDFNLEDLERHLNVKKVKLSYWGYCIALRLLTHVFPNMTSVSLRFGYTAFEQLRHDIDMMLLWSGWMYASTIWDEAISLNSISFAGDTRRHYNERYVFDFTPTRENLETYTRNGLMNWRNRRKMFVN